MTQRSLPPLPCSTRITIRWLSISAIFNRTTSDTRCQAAWTVVSAVRLLRLGIASRKRTTRSPPPAACSAAAHS
ncbi:hypothetical protein ACVWXN_007161 [Bradyrhizobium sp. i1.4.4]